MALFPFHLRGRARLLLPLVGLLALALVVAAVVVTVFSKKPAEGDLPVTRNDAEPAEIVPEDAPAPPPASRPNVVMLLTDDMRTDDLRWMPNVRELVEDQGLSFRNSFSPNPLCAPARASLLTGQYSQNTGVFSVLEDNGFGSFDDSRTLGTSLNEAGYNTVFLGKYLNGYGVQDSKVNGRPSFRYVPPGWTDWYGAVTRPENSGYEAGGTYNYYHVLFNRNGTIDDSHKGRYQTRVEGRIASRLVRKYHRSPKPFFMYLAPIAPHFGRPVEKDDPTGLTWPHTGKKEPMKTAARPKSVRGVFDDRITRASGLPSNGGPSEADVSDKPRPMRSYPELSPAERTAVRDVTRQRAESLYVLDRQVKRLVATLKATGEYDDTVVMITSDNGYFLGEHRLRQGKIRPHEPSLRVPFVMSGPGIPSGTRYDPITTQDVTATILDLADARPPRPADGVSVLPSVEGDRGWRVPVLTEGTQADRVFREAARRSPPGFEDGRTTIGLRTPRWKYVRYNDGDGELYDLDRDANELRNRYGDPRFADVQMQLAALWERYKDCSGEACREPLPEDLQRDPAQNRKGTDLQSRQVERRYGYFR
jgi:N-acetylglucosamine-6-sulfatase